MAHDDEPIDSLDLDVSPSQLTVEQILARTGMDVLELDWDVAVGFDCVTCGTEPACRPSFRITASDLNCPRCQQARRPDWLSRITRRSELVTRTLSELGTPPRAYLSLVTNHGHRLRCRLQKASDVRA